MTIYSCGPLINTPGAPEEPVTRYLLFNCSCFILGTKNLWEVGEAAAAPAVQKVLGKRLGGGHLLSSQILSSAHVN